MRHPTTLPAEQQAHLSAAIHGLTINRVSRELGLSREVVAKLAHGIPVRPGSVALAQLAMPNLPPLAPQAA